MPPISINSLVYIAILHSKTRTILLRTFMNNGVTVVKVILLAKSFGSCI
jgi:hypothetical protein